MPSVKPNSKERTGVSTLLIIIIAFTVTAMLAASLIIRVVLTRQNDINLELSARLEKVELDNTRLLIKSETDCDLTDLEERAENDLGMISDVNAPRLGIQTETEDRAVILQNGRDEWISFFENIFRSGK